MSENLFPAVIEYQPYSICNADCIYCPVGGLNRKRQQRGKNVDEDVFEALLEQTRGRPLSRVSPHLNCEPLLSRNLPEQIHRWKHEHPEAKVEFSTNAVFLTEGLFERLVESGLDELYIHFMGVSKEYHENAMKTSYDRVKKNIESIMKIKNDSFKISIFSHRLAGATLAEWRIFVREWKDKGVDDVVLGALWNRAGYFGDKFNEMSIGLRNSHDHPCPKPFKQIAIEYDGRVVLCSLEYDSEVNDFGNILESTIEEIWNGRVMDAYRQGHSSETLKGLRLCQDCVRGGCYLLDEPILTKLINYQSSEGCSENQILEALAALERF